MRKFLIGVLIGLVITSPAWADRPAARNDDAATVFAGTDGQSTSLAVTQYGEMYTISKPGATNFAKAEDTASAAGDVGVNLLSVRQGTINNDTSTDGDYAAVKSDFYGSIYTHDVGGPANGLLISSAMSAATNNSTNVKASSGVVFHISGCNNQTAARYIKLYNKATAPTCGTDTPVYRFLLPPAPAGACAVIPVTPIGLNFSSGIGYCIVTGAADSDNTAVGLNEVLINIGYK